MFLKSLVIAGSMVVGASAFAQQSSQGLEKTPGAAVNAPSQTQQNGKKGAGPSTMEKKDTGLDSKQNTGGRPGTPGSSGTQSGSQPK